MSSGWWLVHHLQTKVFGRFCKASYDLLCILVVVRNKGSVVSKHEFPDEYFICSGGSFELIDVEQISAKSRLDPDTFVIAIKSIIHNHSEIN